MKNLSEYEKNLEDQKADLFEVHGSVCEIISEYPEIYSRIAALKKAGYTDINYWYVKNNTGISAMTHLKKKHVYRIQISETELKKRYPAAWCVDIQESQVNVTLMELPF